MQQHLPPQPPNIVPSHVPSSVSVDSHTYPLDPAPTTPDWKKGGKSVSFFDTSGAFLAESRATIDRMEKEAKELERTYREFNYSSLPTSAHGESFRHSYPASLLPWQPLDSDVSYPALYGQYRTSTVATPSSFAPPLSLPVQTPTYSHSPGNLQRSFMPAVQLPGALTSFTPSPPPVSTHPGIITPSPPPSQQSSSHHDIITPSPPPTQPTVTQTFPVSTHQGVSTGPGSAPSPPPSPPPSPSTPSPTLPSPLPAIPTQQPLRLQQLSSETQPSLSRPLQIQTTAATTVVPALTDSKPFGESSIDPSSTSHLLAGSNYLPATSPVTVARDAPTNEPVVAGFPAHSSSSTTKFSSAAKSLLAAESSSTAESSGPMSLDSWWKASKPVATEKRSPVDTFAVQPRTTQEESDSNIRTSTVAISRAYTSLTESVQAPILSVAGSGKDQKVLREVSPETVVPPETVVTGVTTAQKTEGLTQRDPLDVTSCGHETQSPPAESKPGFKVEEGSSGPGILSEAKKKESKDEDDEDGIDPVMLKYMQLVKEKRQERETEVC